MLDLDEKTWNLISGMGMIVVAIGLMIVGAKAIIYYRRQLLEDEPLSTTELLEQFQRSLEMGEIDEVEFRRIKESLEEDQRLTTKPRSEMEIEQFRTRQQNSPSQSTPVDEKEGS